MALKFLCLASGSSGNCYYLGASDYGFLFDVGIGIRTIKKTLKDNKIDFARILAVFVTHDHSDHIKSVGSLNIKYQIPVYTTERIHSAIMQSCYVDKNSYNPRTVIAKDQSVQIRDFRITAFEIPHDANDCVGYHIRFENHNVVLATDVGHINDTLIKYAGLANHLIIESNYDKDMLLEGRYPKYLKQRIMNGSGHLSNHETAQFLATHAGSQLKNVWLCHLSRDNNRPELAYKTVADAMRQNGIRVGEDINLVPLQRSTPSELYIFE